ncbi:molybdopterin biosynthesis protein, partial [Aquicoccus sp. SCR17]|nr:molybdopterin biosynthesis protein [Carideicomes alvinocaridis]
MTLVLVLAAVLLALGWATGMPWRARLLLLSLLWVGVVAAHVILPDGHPLRLALGGQAAPWLILGGMVGIGLLYGRLVAGLKGRARARDGAAAP